MAALRGERFHIDLSDDEDGAGHSSGPASKPSLFGNLVKDIQERPSSEKQPPSAPSLSNKSHSSGFPVHKKRTGISRFKADRSSKTSQDPLPVETASSNEAQQSPRHLKLDSAISQPPVENDDEKRSIDEENRKRLASMSPAEIENERKELMSSMSPALLKRLLSRATIDDKSGSDDFPGIESTTTSSAATNPEKIQPIDTSRTAKHVAFADDAGSHETGPSLPKTPYASSFPSDLQDEDEEDNDMNDTDQDDRDPAATHLHQDSTIDPTSQSLPPASTHFPRPPQPPPTLDPSSPNFLTDLHTKYFPSLPSDPSKLAWMSSPSQPTPEDPDEDHSYNPIFGADSIPVTQLRFGFAGELLPPSVSVDISVDKGLHHHGDNPEAAGYTIPELAHLARSSVPSQRCVSFQILGRILYRLGLGEFGGREKKGTLATVRENDDGDDDAGGENWQEGAGRRGGGNTVLETGMWDCMQRGRVIETLQEEVGRDRGHVSAKAYATEALWLWQKGGGKKVMAT